MQILHAGLSHVGQSQLGPEVSVLYVGISCNVLKVMDSSVWSCS